MNCRLYAVGLYIFLRGYVLGRRINGGAFNIRGGPIDAGIEKALRNKL